MSRCFPYPPPGYTLSRATKDSLIESIKKADKSHLVQSHIGEKIGADTKGKFLHKGTKAEAEQLEQSSLTEEHGKPVCLHVPNTSCDSTENSSNKRKRHSSPEEVTRGHGKLIRIKLPPKKQNQSDAPSNEQQRCSTSGKTHNPSQNENVRQMGEDFSRAEQICSTSQPIETFVARKIPNPSTTGAVLTPMQKAELQYKNLIESLVPPQPHDALLNADDSDWLFKGKNQEFCGEKKRISGNDSMSCSSSSGLWPRAQYLREVDVYALPFTVPF
ncbi:hypothetical protein DH2020_007457 [Rehmannia glutinosa]|uniref:Uncharacterized protein n=1 Tax=Rehmannia glutinosa TaxID=99300 RepID=A0ABR0TY46_REHGL